jgi:glutamyl-tRNA synthetase
MMNAQPSIIGRYAPSPTGALHLGNLRTALVAWLSARSQNGQFLLRMEDLDTPRVVPGSADQILQDLEWLGLDWDGPVMYQSKRIEAYQQAMDDLSQQNLVYPCFCSRKDIQQASSAPHGNTSAYAGTCRGFNVEQRRQKAQHKNPSYRVIASDELQSEVGDFVIKRADGLFAYQLSVVVDDLEQGVTEVVRGADLISSTSRQLYLAHQLQPKQKPINYFHAPLMLDKQGRRMSKRDGSESLSSWRGTGKNAPELLAHFAKSLGMKLNVDKISLSELLDITDSDFLHLIFTRNINGM